MAAAEEGRYRPAAMMTAPAKRPRRVSAKTSTAHPRGWEQLVLLLHARRLRLRTRPAASRPPGHAAICPPISARRWAACLRGREPTVRAPCVSGRHAAVPTARARTSPRPIALHPEARRWGPEQVVPRLLVQWRRVASRMVRVATLPLRRALLPEAGPLGPARAARRWPACVAARYVRPLPKPAASRMARAVTWLPSFARPWGACPKARQPLVQPSSVRPRRPRLAACRMASACLLHPQTAS